MKKVFDFISNALEAGMNVGLAVVAESAEMSPAEPGFLMAVREDGVISGTIGGGAVEYRVIQDTLSAMKEGVRAFNFEHDLTKDAELGMICGGRIKGVVTIMETAKRLIIFGGGHCGRELAKMANIAGFHVVLCEDREEFANLDGVHETLLGDMQETARNLNFTSRDYVVIVTRGHALDLKVLEETCQKDVAYLGMIGSKAKVWKNLNAIREQGVPEEIISKIYAPIGLTVDNGSAQEIAVSILAEILCVKNKTTPVHMRDRNKNV